MIMEPSRQLLGVAVTTVVAATVLLTPNPASAPEPAVDVVEPALPDAVYEVPPNIPDIGDDPLGEPAALAYSGEVRPGVFAEEDYRPLVVGAESGRVRAVRDVPRPLGSAVLSPDGTMLAARDGWVWTDADIDPDPGPPDLLVVDLVTGESTRHVLPDDGFGGGVERLTWTPDSAALAATLVMASESGVAGRVVYGYLDVTAGDWHLEGDGSALAISRDGLRTVVAEIEASTTGSYGTLAIHNRVEGAQPVAEVAMGRPYGAVFSPDGRWIASVARRSEGSHPSWPHELEIFDSDTGEAVARIELGDYQFAGVLGWGERGALVRSTRVEESGTGGVVIAVVERIDVSEPDDPVRSTVIDQAFGGIDIPAAFLDADTRTAAPPEVGFDWAARVPDPYLLIMFGGVLVALLIAHLWRRARSGLGSPTVRASSDR